MKATVKLYSLPYSDIRTYCAAAMFVAGNIALPQICHLAPHGGQMFLPIFFFTLVGAYKYGFTVGLATAVLSPIANSMLFSMPSAQITHTLACGEPSSLLTKALGTRPFNGSGEARLCFLVICRLLRLEVMNQQFQQFAHQ